jgi:O-antigen biosynthesis protein
MSQVNEFLGEKAKLAAGAVVQTCVEGPARSLLSYYRRAVPLSVRAVVSRFVRSRTGGKFAARMSFRRKIGYRRWIDRNDALNDGDRDLICRHILSFRELPKFSILMPVYNSPTQYLREAIDSILRQLYADWELCVVDDASTDPEIRKIIKEYADRDGRIRPKYRDVNGGISACSKSAFDLASGDWVVLMDQDDTLSEHALYLVAELINRHHDAAIIYSDEDHITSSGRRYEPYFKPDWDYDLFIGQNYINHLSVYRAELVGQAGGFREGYDGSQDWDLTLRVLEVAGENRVHHIPSILYHWRQTSQTFSSTSIATALDSARRAIMEHFQRTGKPAEVTAAGQSSYLRVRWKLPSQRPLASVIIPTKDRGDLLRTCVNGLINRTDYQPLEIILVDNGSSNQNACALLEELGSRPNVKIVENKEPFNFSRLTNLGVAASTGDVCILLNNDIDVINSDWATEMIGVALRPEVGAVGAKLYYPTDQVQHGGVVLGLGGVAGHKHRYAARSDSGYFGQLKLTHTVSCVTAACLVLRRNVYDEVGGFNERDLAVAFNDVDFCIRIRAAGYKVIWTPHAELYHYESASRRWEATKKEVSRFNGEINYMRARWGSLLDTDPFYNSNLSFESECFDLAETPRACKPWMLAASR